MFLTFNPLKGNGFPETRTRTRTRTTTTPGGSFQGPVRGVRDEHFHDSDDDSDDDDEKRNQKRRWRRRLDVVDDDDDDADDDDDVFARLPIFERKVAKIERKSGE